MKKVVLMLFILVLCSTFVFANGSTESSTAAKKTVAYPTKEITIIIPWNPGGTNDLMARAMQPIFKSMYNVDLVVKNVPGGGSAVGITEAMIAKPDGYTLGLATSSYLALIAQGRVSSAFDDASNMMNVAQEPVCLVVKAKGKYADAEAVIAAAKAKSKSISVGIPGSNNVNQAYATLLQEEIGSEFNFMPFDGGSRIVAELIGGHIDAGVLKPSETITQVRAGELAIVGVFNKDGIAILPEVPTFDSLGYDVFRLGNIQQTAYLMGPKGIDSEIQTKIIDMFTNVLKSEEYKAFADQVGINVAAFSGTEFDTFIHEVYDGLVKASEEIFTK
ncbi:MAG: tripartite tricarboxylate transporter substrate binding protein [Sphaerochaeta sp.]